MALPNNAKPNGFQQITVLSSAVGLTDPATNGPSHVVTLQGEGGNIRMRDDGTDPSTTVGSYLIEDNVYEYDGDLTTVKFIEETASSKLNITYYRK